MPTTKRGFTLIEILIATAVAVLIMGAVSSVFYYLLTVPPQQTDQLNAENQLRISLDWIQRDGVQAHSFTRNEGPCSTSPYPDSDYYGYFSSYTDPSCVNPDDPDCAELYVAYRYDDVNDQLVREESIGCDSYPSKTTTMAFHVVDMGDVAFCCDDEITLCDEVTLCDGLNPITVNMTVTMDRNREEISITDARYIEMRAASE